MKYFAVALTLACSVALTTPAHASALSRLSFNGTPDVLNDTDWEAFVQRDGSDNLIFSRDGDGNINVGDLVIGVIEISDSIDGNPVGGVGSETFLAVLAAQVVDTTGGLTFAAVSDGDYSDLMTTFGLPGRGDSNSAVLIYDGEVGDLTPTTWASVNDAFGQVAGGDNALLVEFGPGNINDFSEGTLTTGTLAVGDINSDFDFLFSGGLSVTKNYTGIEFGPHDNRMFGVQNQLQFTGNSVVDEFNATALNGGPFDFQTQTIAAINPTGVPEPTSLTLFALGGLGLLGAGSWRRRKSAKNTQAAL